MSVFYDSLIKASRKYRWVRPALYIIGGLGFVTGTVSAFATLAGWIFIAPTEFSWQRHGTWFDTDKLQTTFEVPADWVEIEGASVRSQGYVATRPGYDGLEIVASTYALEDDDPRAFDETARLYRYGVLGTTLETIPMSRTTTFSNWECNFDHMGPETWARHMDRGGGCSVVNVATNAIKEGFDKTLVSAVVVFADRTLEIQCVFDSWLARLRFTRICDRAIDSILIKFNQD